MYTMVNFDEWFGVLKTYLELPSTKEYCLNYIFKTATDANLTLALISESGITDLTISSTLDSTNLYALAQLLLRGSIRKLRLESKLLFFELVYILKVLEECELTALEVEVIDFKTWDKFSDHFLKSKLETFKVTLTNEYQLSDRMLFGNRRLRIPNRHIRNSTEWTKILLHQKLTNLQLKSIRLNSDELKSLCKYLKTSNIITLNLSGNDIGDAGITHVLEHLEGTKVRYLDISLNGFTTLLPFVKFLKSTRIEVLIIAGNAFRGGEILGYPDFLRQSSLREFYVTACQMNDNVCAHIIKSSVDSSLNVLNLLGNYNAEETAKALFENLKRTSIINLSLNVLKNQFNLFQTYKLFVSKSKVENLTLLPNDSEIVSFKSISNVVASFEKTDIDTLRILAPVSRFSVQDLNYFFKETPFANVAVKASLFFEPESVSSASLFRIHEKITHLTLSSVSLGEKGAILLATSIYSHKNLVYLDLTKNQITNAGATALIRSLKEGIVCQVILKDNLIENDGFKAIAKEIEHNFTITCDVDENPGKQIEVIEKVVLTNRIFINKLAIFMRRIVPATNKPFCFEIHGDTDIESFLHECLDWFKNISLPRIAAATWLEGANSFTKCEVLSLLAAFPVQFASYLGTVIETDLEGYLSILKYAEKLELTSVVEHLLLHRSLYVIDSPENILHPTVYLLLHKYKQPIYGLDASEKEKLIQYFIRNINMEGAWEVIDLLLKQI